jgi:uncharacterized protein YkwD
MIRHSFVILILIVAPFGGQVRGDDQRERDFADCLAAHNAARKRFDANARRWLEPLQLDERLCKAAQDHADWMARTSTIHHIGANKSTWFERAAAAGYHCDHTTCSENVAEGPAEFMTGAEACACWLRSRVEHRDNVLSAEWRHVGFGHATAKNGRRFWCALYARPRSVLR